MLEYEIKDALMWILRKSSTETPAGQNAAFMFLRISVWKVFDGHILHDMLGETFLQNIDSFSSSLQLVQSLLPE